MCPEGVYVTQTSAASTRQELMATLTTVAKSSSTITTHPATIVIKSPSVINFYCQYYQDSVISQSSNFPAVLVKALHSLTSTTCIVKSSPVIHSHYQYYKESWSHPHAPIIAMYTSFTHTQPTTVMEDPPVSYTQTALPKKKKNTSHSHQPSPCHELLTLLIHTIDWLSSIHREQGKNDLWWKNTAKNSLTPWAPVTHL